MKHDVTRKLTASAPVNSVQTSGRCSIAREFGDPLKMRKQKTVTTGALITDTDKWKSINWKQVRYQVRRLQMRIAKAVMGNRWNKVRVLQNLLTRSFYAKLLAVKRVTSNKGKKTPGIDGVLWKSSRASGKLFLACTDVDIGQNR